jgi:hypothetical protein
MLQLILQFLDWIETDCRAEVTCNLYNSSFIRIYNKLRSQKPWLVISSDKKFVHLELCGRQKNCEVMMNSIDAEQSTSNGSPGSWTAAHRTNQTVMMMIIIKFGESNFSCSSTSAEQESFLSSVCHLWTQLVKLRAFLPSCLYGVCLPQLSYLSHANLCCWLCTPKIPELRSAVESQVPLESFVCLSVMLTSCGWGILEWDFPCLLIHMSQA